MHLISLESVDSTQDEAKRQLSLGLLTSKTVILAREQVAGRGTQDRAWLSDKDSGLFMTVVHVSGDLMALPVTAAYTQAAALACAKALKALYGLEIQIKPVNDLYAQGRKLGGILVESTSQGEGLSSILTGIGINYASVQLPEIASYQAIGLEELLSVEALQQHSRQALVMAIAEEVDRVYQRLIQEGEAGILSQVEGLLI